MIDNHYHFSDGHLTTVKGYEFYEKIGQTYAKMKEPSRQAKATEFYVSIQVVGTPDDCIQKIAELHKLSGLDHLITEFSFGGMPHEEAELGMRLFADKVLPVLQRDTSFAPPASRVGRRRRSRCRKVCSLRRDPDDGSRPMDHVRSIKFDRLRLIACQRMHSYQDWTYVRIQDRRSHAASGRMGQAAARGKPIMPA